MLDDAHDDDRVVFSIGLILQEITLDHFPVKFQLVGASAQVFNRRLRVADPGAADAALGGIFKPRAPARPDFEQVIAAF
jgi:hypothetical protein